MSKIDAFETALLAHIFQNAALPNVGDAAGLLPSAAAGNLYLSLLTADPTETGTVSEANYTGYARVPIARSAAGWDVTNNVASNVSTLTFGTCTAGTSTVTFFGIHTAATAGSFLYGGPLSGVGSGLVISSTQNQQPIIAAGALTITED